MNFSTNVNDGIYQVGVGFTAEQQKKVIEMTIAEIGTEFVHTSKVGGHWFNLQNQSEDTPWPFRERMTPGLDWQWIDHPLVEYVRSLLGPVYEYYSELTRISVQITPMNYGAPPHWDFGGYRTDCNPVSEYDGWTLRIPLSPHPEDTPFWVIIGGVKYNITSQCNAFAYSEYKTFHGSDARNYYRGVIGINGVKKKSPFKQAAPMVIGMESHIENLWDISEITKFFMKVDSDLFGEYQDYLRFTVGDDIFDKVIEERKHV